ncbi:hypothetical protein OG311_04295 [Streptomyces sp. NBC_01343]|uniref:hypothetical protein n=1 Tax=Streptomyces sp. NBC_01343 TaxID=2903832 RepID=UPI002E16396A|nr:hypothetical protein OG311_04295 [Streptomyces sp. NBC_01343]
MPTALALRLAADPDDGVRPALSLREDLTEEQRSAIAYVVPHGYHTPPRRVVARGHEPEVARRAAASGHVLLRRSIAMQVRLPADVVELLAADEDFFVKPALCECCEDAPHELVVEMYAHWHGLKWSFLRRLAVPGSARSAAANPALPPAVTHRLLDLAGVASGPVV